MSLSTKQTHLNFADIFIFGFKTGPAELSKQKPPGYLKQQMTRRHNDRQSNHRAEQENENQVFYF